MNTLAYTLALLTLLATLTYGRIHQGLNQGAILSAIQNHMEETRKLEDKYQQELFHLKCITRKTPQFRGGSKKPSQGSGKPQKPHVRFFPYKLNLAHVSGVYEELAIELIQHLYPEYREEIPKIFERIRGVEIEIERPEDLACLPGGKVWVELLKGDFLEHITFAPDRKKKIYAAFVSQELADVLFEDPEMAMLKILSLREDYKEKQIEKEDFMAALEQIPVRAKYAKLVSYKLSYEPKAITVKSDTLKRLRQPVL